MNVFLSWAGERSKQTAELLQSWLKCVLQVSQPWISSKDVDRGSLWFSEINDRLQETAVGIICLTKENQDRPWILFEAGALAKGLSNNRVCTLLMDLEETDVRDPLAQFNHTRPTKEGMYQLIRTLNRASGEAALTDPILEQVFATNWPWFQEKVAEILSSTANEKPVKKRTNDDLLTEILSNTRSVNSRLAKLEHDFRSLQGDAVTTRGPIRTKTTSLEEIKAKTNRSPRLLSEAEMRELFNKVRSQDEHPNIPKE